MGKIIIQPETPKNPITLIGRQAGVCYGSDTSDDKKNFARGLDCLKSGHGRTWEFPDIYMILDGYSARVIREWYTHIGGMPTRLQASTRYIKYQKGFDYITPPSVLSNKDAQETYINAMENILNALKTLETMGVPKEDSANLLPLGMTTTVVCKHNARNIIDMSRNRKCVRAYWEFRNLFKDLEKALSEYSPEWEYIVKNYFKTKCEIAGKCLENNSCGRYPKD